MIDIQHVTKRYGALYALRDVSLHVEKGSVLGLLGQNGAGKTTLINILTGYLAPTEGRALLAGHDALLEPEEAGRLYRAFGQAAAALPEKWRVYILSSHPEFEACYGSLAAKKRKLYNGMIKCDLFMYYR